MDAAAAWDGRQRPGVEASLGRGHSPLEPVQGHQDPAQ